MSTDDHGTSGDGQGLIGRIRRYFSHSKPRLEDCAHPHARLVGVEGSREQTTVLVCEECGGPLDAHDPTLRRKQHLSEAKVCVECAETHWTIGTRRSV